MSLGGHGDLRLTDEYDRTGESFTRAHWYLLIQLGYHLHSLVHVAGIATKRNDFVEMMLHHYVTVLAIGNGYVAVGFCVGCVNILKM